MSALAVVKKALQAYVDKDRDAIEAIVAADYRFTSPIDNGLDRATYFAHCWPGSATIGGFDIVHEAESGEMAWVVYEGTAGGKRMRNAEVHRVRDGQLVETQVYFGWSLPHQAPAGGFVDADQSKG